jgi:hypothetical protein
VLLEALRLHPEVDSPTSIAELDARRRPTSPVQPRPRRLPYAPASIVESSSDEEEDDDDLGVIEAAMAGGRRAVSTTAAAADGPARKSSRIKSKASDGIAADLLRTLRRDDGPPAPRRAHRSHALRPAADPIREVKARTVAREALDATPAASLTTETKRSVPPKEIYDPSVSAKKPQHSRKRARAPTPPAGGILPNAEGRPPKRSAAAAMERTVLNRA